MTARRVEAMEKVRRAVEATGQELGGSCGIN